MPEDKQNIPKAAQWLQKSLKVFLLFLLGFYGLLLSIYLALLLVIHVPVLHRQAVDYLLDYLQNETETSIQLEALDIEFPESLLLRELYVEDRQGDTLWYSQRLKITLAPGALLQQKIRLREVALSRARGYVFRSPGDSSFNYQFLIDAFVSEDSTAIEEQPDSSNQEGWQFSVGTLSLRDIKIAFQDSLTENYYNLRLGRFSTAFDRFDTQDMAFYLQDIVLENTSAQVILTPVPSTDEETNEPLPDFRFQKLILSDFEVDYEDRGAKSLLKVDLPTAELSAKEIDLRSKQIDLERLHLDKAQLTYRQFETQKTTDSVETVAQDSVFWNVNLEQIELTNNQLVYDDANFAAQKGTFDYHHIRLSELDFYADQFQYNKEGIKLDVDQLSFLNHQDFRLQKLKGDFALTDQDFSWKQGELRTGKSRLISEDFTFTFPQTGSESFEKVLLNWKQGRLAMSELYYFAPDLRQTLPLPEKEVLLFTINAQGSAEQMQLRKFRLKMLSETELKAKGSFRNLLRPEELMTDLTIQTLRTTKEDLRILVPDTLWPEKLTIPEKMALSGQFQGGLSDIKTDLELKSSLGDVFVKGNYQDNPQFPVDRINAKFRLDDFQLGRFLQDTSLNIVSLTLSLKGKGLLRGTADWNYSLFVPEFDYLDHRFRRIRSKGELDGDLADVSFIVRDSLLNMRLNAKLMLDSPRYELQAMMELEQARLKQLGLYSDSLTLSTNLNASGEWRDTENFSSKLRLTKTKIKLPRGSYRMDTLKLDAQAQNRQFSMKLQSDFADGKMEGLVDPAEIPALLASHLNDYMHFQESQDTVKKPSHFTFELKLKDSRPLTLFVPDLLYVKDEGLTGSYDSRTHSLEMEGTLDKVIYTNQYIADSLHYRFYSKGKEADISVEASQISIDSSIVYAPAFNAEIQKDSFDIRINVPETDDQNELVYELGGHFESSPEEVLLSLDPRKIILNNDQWTINRDNFIRISSEGVTSNRLELSHEGQKIAFQLQKDDYQLETEDLQLHTLSRYLTNIDTTDLLGGKMNTRFRMKEVNGKQMLETILTIDDFSFKGAELGDLRLEVVQPQKELYKALLKLEGANNRVDMEGFYDAKAKTEALDMDLLVDLDLESLEPIFDEIDSLRGRLQGKLKLKGTLEEPALFGQLAFKKAGFNVKRLNAYFRMDHDQLFFEGDKIALRDFTLDDEQNKPFYVNGNILTEDYREFRFDLELHAQDFLAVNSSKADNEFYYGKLLVDLDVEIKGTQDAPDVDAIIQTKKGTSLTYVNFSEELRSVGSEGVVNFVDFDAPVDSALLEARQKMQLADTLKKQMQGLQFDAEVIIDENTEFTLITDPLSDNYLYLKGGGTLNMKMTQSGDVNLFGTYIVKEGKFYLAFYGLIQEEFNLQKGSRVIWKGDPMRASMNITAEINKRTRPLPLLTYFGTVLSPEQKNTYQQRMNFLVYLLLEGELLAPEISFQLGLAEIDQGRFPAVDGTLDKLNQQKNQDIREKQVFSLLVFGGFISNSPSSFTGRVSSAARQTVNTILSNQLNSLSDKYLKGVDVSFELDTYSDFQSGGERTRLGVQLARQFLDNRLNVQIGGRLDLTGLSDDEKQDLQDIAGDVAIIYALTRDQRYKVKAFRRLEFDALDGDIVTTGASFILLKEFNKFKSQKIKNIRKKMRKEERNMRK